MPEEQSLSGHLSHLFHTAEDLALSLSLEASELLEIFQWKSAEEGLQDLEATQEELADVLIYAYMLASDLSLDIDEIIQDKLEKICQIYPLDKSYGNKQKYDDY